MKKLIILLAFLFLGSSQTRFSTNVVDAGADVNFTNPSNAVTSDNTYATVSISSITAGLIANDFGFNIPAGSTNLSAVIDVEHKNSVASEIISINFAIHNNSTLLDQQAIETYEMPTSDTHLISSSLSANLTIAIINSTTFGGYIDYNGSATLISVDCIKMTITYTDSATGEARRVVGYGKSLVKIPKDGIHAISDLKKP